MKKNLLKLLTGTALSLLVTQGVSAQTLVESPSKKGLREATIALPNAAELSYGKSVKQRNKMAVTEEFNLRGAFINAGNNTTGVIVNLEDDSNLLVRYVDENNNFILGASNSHHVGNIFDPRAGVFLGNPVQLSQYNAYTIDSLYMLYRYIRHNSDTNDDTLTFQYYRAGAIQDVGIQGDDVAIGSLTYDYTTNLGVNAFDSETILLNTADTSSGEAGQNGGFIVTAAIALAPNASVSANERFAFSVKYKQGRPTNLGDTLEALDETAQAALANKYNQFEYVRFRLDGLFKETTTAIPAAQRIYLNGLFVGSDVRTNTSAQGWNGQYYPGIFRTGANGPNATNFVQSVFVVSSPNVGFRNMELEGYDLGEAYPNPVNLGQSSKVDFSIGQTEDVSIVVYNMMGQEISTIMNETMNAGDHTVEIDLSNLSAGVYYYTMNAGQYSSTQKIVVR